MSQTKVIILGASGMLGSMVTDFLSRDEKLSITATVRSPELIKKQMTIFAMMPGIGTSGTYLKDRIIKTFNR